MNTLPDALIDRYRRFKFRHFDQNAEQYEQLAEFGQSPDTMIVSCCDSRVTPEAVFSALPGEMFVVRNIANLVPPFKTDGASYSVSSALEFAVLNLKVEHIVVMGHAQCGGVKAALAGGAPNETDARFIANWISMLEPAAAEARTANPHASSDELQHAAEYEGVKASIANLRTFPFVREAEQRNELKLHGTWFDISAGTLKVLNPETGTFETV